MQVREIMTENPASCTPESSLSEVARMMVENDCGCIPIVDSHLRMKPVGTITDRDIAIRTVAANQNPLDLKASDIMTVDVVTVSPEMSVEECTQVMQDKQIRRVLVVDESGSCVGIVAQADVAQEGASAQRTAETVREISEPNPSLETDASWHAGDSRYYSAGDSFLKTESFLTFLAGIGSGAALMYFLDPDRGRRRRALVRDQMTSMANTAQDTLDKTQRDLSNRAYGLWAETKKAVTGKPEPSPQRDVTETNQPIGRTANNP